MTTKAARNKDNYYGGDLGRGAGDRSIGLSVDRAEQLYKSEQVFLTARRQWKLNLNLDSTVRIRSLDSNSDSSAICPVSAPLASFVATNLHSGMPDRRHLLLLLPLALISPAFVSPIKLAYLIYSNCLTRLRHWFQVGQHSCSHRSHWPGLGNPGTI